MADMEELRILGGEVTIETRTGTAEELWRQDKQAASELMDMLPWLRDQVKQIEAKD